MPYMEIGQINSVFTVFRRRQSLSVRVDNDRCLCAVGVEYSIPDPTFCAFVQ